MNALETTYDIGSAFEANRSSTACKGCVVD
jgi:hypothetical protein